MNNYEYYVDENGNSEFPVAVLQDYHVREELRAYEETGVKMGYGNATSGARIYHHIDYDKFEKCIERVINENDQLRSICVKRGDKFMQKIVRHIDFKLNVIEAEGSTAEEKYQFAMDYCQTEALKAIDFMNDVAYKIEMIKLAEDDNILMIFAHHWIGDGYSISLILNTTLAYYLNPDMSPQNTVKYIDYVKEIEEFRNTPKGIEQKKYWDNEFKDYEPFDMNSIDFGEPSDGFDGMFTIEQDIINRVAKNLKVTSFNIFHCALHVAISLFTGKYDTLVGATSANRTIKYRATVGFFARPVLVRLIINDDNDRLSDLIRTTVNKFSKGLSNIRLADRVDLIQFTNPYQNIIAKGEKIREKIKIERLIFGTKRMIKTGVFTVTETDDKLVVATVGSGEIVTGKFVSSVRSYLNCFFEAIDQNPEATVADVKRLYEKTMSAGE